MLELSSKDFATSDHPKTALSADPRPEPKSIGRLTPTSLRASAADQALLDLTVDDLLEDDLLAELASALASSQ